MVPVPIIAQGLPNFGALRIARSFLTLLLEVQKSLQVQIYHRHGFYRIYCLHK